MAALRPTFIARAMRLGRRTFDTAAPLLHGIQFASRLGDDLPLYAIFERAGDPAVSPTLTDRTVDRLAPHDPDIVEAFRLLDLQWGRVD